ncbi:hypothetical protein AB0H12_21370 [Actinosynnema sp. NPDC023794]
MSDPNQPPRANPDPADRTPTTPPAADQPADATTPMATPTPDPAHQSPTSAPDPGGQPAAQPAAASGERASAQPTAGGGQASAQPTFVDQPAAAHQAPGSPHPGHYPPPPGKGAAVGRVVKHRATQLVAVGLLGLVLGGGIVALADRDHHPRYGVGSDRPGHSRFDERGDRGDRPDRGERGERGPDRVPQRDFER